MEFWGIPFIFRALHFGVWNITSHDGPKSCGETESSPLLEC